MVSKLTASALCGLLMTTCAARSEGRTIYVTEGGRGDGASWQHALGSVAAALAAARSGDEVWVAAGTYRPTAGTDRDATFALVSGVGLYGGFAGDEAARDQRNWRRHTTILSGDIGQREVAADNVYHVVTGADSAVLDGFTIRGGQSPEPGQGTQRGAPPSAPQGNQPAQGQGGPPGADEILARFDRDRDLRISRQEAPPPLQRDFDRLDTNRDGFLTSQELQTLGRPAGGQAGGPGGPQGGQARSRQGSGPTTHTTPDAVAAGPQPVAGAGMINYQCAPTVRNCVFRDNVAMKGGGVYNMVSTSFPPRDDSSRRKRAQFIGCDFINNTAMARGGGVANDLGTHPIFVNCRFVDNECFAKGGGMYNDFGCSPALLNCLFAGNRAAAAAAIGNDGGSSPTIDQTTFTANHATAEGPSLYQGSGPPNEPIVTRSIFWRNTCDAGPAGIYNWHDCFAKVTDSIVEDGYPGAGNQTIDPRFRDPSQGDWRPAAGSPAGGLGWDPDRPVASDSIPEPPAPARLSGTLPRPTPPSAAGLARGPVVYVKSGATGAADGASWATAYPALQPAIDHAWATGAAIWVAQGVYHPTGDGRHATFALRDTVAVYGGFRGVETSLQQRDRRANPTILSGDLGVVDDLSDNAYHVVSGANQAVLDSFIITGGNADGYGFDGQGGGLINYLKGTHSRIHEPGGGGLSPTLINCQFIGNRAKEGGAVYSYDRAKPVFDGCTFTHNQADFGAAILDRVGVISTITNCLFEDNEAAWHGGAIYLDYGPRPRISRTRFEGNRAGGHGGAIYTVSRASQLEATIAAFEDCSFKGNAAKLRGGAVANDDQSQITLSRCVLEQNRSGQTGGAVSDDRQALTTLTDCTLTGNDAAEGVDDHQPAPRTRMPGT